MIIKVEVNDFYTLKENSWSGAVDNLNLIEKYNLQDEFMQYLNDVFCDYEPTDTEVNDAIWFMDDISDFITEQLDVSDIEDVDELLDIAKNLYYDEVVSTIRDIIQNDAEKEFLNFIQNYDNVKEVFDNIDNFELEEEEE